MSLKAFKKVGSENKDVVKVQDNLDAYFSQFESSNIIDGILFKDIEITTGTPKRIEHKLGRKLLGWIVVRKNANADVWQAGSDSTKLLYLSADANVTIDLWVF